MDFIADNYVWFIVLGVIILMAVIGYIADKTDFGRKAKSEGAIEKPKKEKKKKENKPKENKIKIEAKGINELSQKLAENNTAKIDNLDNNVNQNIINSNLEQSINNENIDQSLFAPLTDEKPVDSIQEENIPDKEELKNIEPTKLENPIPEKSSQPVTEDEDIWNF